jgi:hypothetical protein
MSEPELSESQLRIVAARSVIMRIEKMGTMSIDTMIVWLESIGRGQARQSDPVPILERPSNHWEN